MEFINRDVQYPNRVRLIKEGETEGDLYTIQRAEGNINSEGTPLNADTFNDLQTEIGTIFAPINNPDFTGQIKEAGQRVYSPNNPPSTVWEEVTVTKASGISGILQAFINRVTKVMFIRIESVNGPSSMGGKIGTIFLPSGYSITIVSRTVITMDLTGGGRISTGLDVMPDGSLLVYPHARNSETWGGILFGNAWVKLD